MRAFFHIWSNGRLSNLNHWGFISSKRKKGTEIPVNNSLLNSPVILKTFIFIIPPWYKREIRGT